MYIAANSGRRLTLSFPGRPHFDHGATSAPRSDLCFEPPLEARAYGTVAVTPIIKASRLKRNGYEEERVADERIADKQVSFSADRRENQGARRLARRDAQPGPYPGQGSRS